MRFHISLEMGYFVRWHFCKIKYTIYYVGGENKDHAIIIIYFSIYKSEQLLNSKFLLELKI